MTRSFWFAYPRLQNAAKFLCNHMWNCTLLMWRQTTRSFWFVYPRLKNAAKLLCNHIWTHRRVVCDAVKQAIRAVHFIQIQAVRAYQFCHFYFSLTYRCVADQAVRGFHSCYRHLSRVWLFSTNQVRRVVNLICYHLSCACCFVCNQTSRGFQFVYFHLTRMCRIFWYYTCCVGRFFWYVGYYILWHHFIGLCKEVARETSLWFSPAGCFTSTGLFVHYLVKHHQSGSLFLWGSVAYCVAAHASFSIGILLLGHSLNKVHRLPALGTACEAWGAWLFMNLDFSILSTVWEMFTATSRLIVRYARQVAIMLKWVVLNTEKAIDVSVRAMWALWCACFRSVVVPVCVHVWKFLKNLIRSIWNNPVLCLVLSAGVVYYAYHVHLGRLSSPFVFFSRYPSWLLGAILAIFRGIYSFSKMALAVASDFVQGCVGVIGSVIVPMTGNGASQAYDLLSGLAESPIELFARPGFAVISATTTMAFSRLALVNTQSSSLAIRERIRLATRMGRTSQRMLLIPILVSATCSKTASLVVMRLAYVVVPFGVFYVFACLLFAHNEVRGWAATTRDLKKSRRSKAVVEFVQNLDESDDCAICLEPLRGDSKHSAECLRHVAVSVVVKNAPRTCMHEPATLELRVWHIDENGIPSHDCCVSCTTTLGKFYLTLNADATYWISLIDKNWTSRTMTKLTLQVTHALASRSQRNPVGKAGICLVLEGPPDGARSMPADWEFEGMFNPASGPSVLKFHATAPEVGALTCARTNKVPVLEMADLGPPTALITVTTPQQEVELMNCGHAFHTKCIKEWLGRNNRCPLCREVIVAGRMRLAQALF